MQRIAPLLAGALAIFTTMGCAPNTEHGSEAQPIVSGQVDSENRYNNVGTTMVQNPDGTYRFTCSGALIGPRHFVTAAHCLAPPEVVGWRVYVSFAVTPTTPQYTGVRRFQHPGFNPYRIDHMDDPRDIGVIELDRDVEGVEPVQLPTLNQFGSLGPIGLRGTRFRTVGYGAHDVEPTGIVRDFTRRYADGTFSSLTAAWLTLNKNYSTPGDNGGSCVHDSGGPHFFEDTNVLASITSLGDPQCRRLDKTYRVDTQVARDFLGQFVALP